MKIAVGSTNPVKIQAVRQVATQVWPEADISQIAVKSGISSMPLSADETLRGAQNRAQAALSHGVFDMGIGLEGGVNQETSGLMLMGWVVVVDKYGREGVGGTARLPLPAFIAGRVLAGEELGHIMDDLLHETNVKQKGGAIGALTAGLVPRSEAFATAVAYALGRFLVPDLYDHVSN